MPFAPCVLLPLLQTKPHSQDDSCCWPCSVMVVTIAVIAVPVVVNYACYSRCCCCCSSKSSCDCSFVSFCQSFSCSFCRCCCLAVDAVIVVAGVVLLVVLLLLLLLLLLLSMLAGLPPPTVHGFPSMCPCRCCCCYQSRCSLPLRVPNAAAATPLNGCSSAPSRAPSRRKSLAKP